MEKITKNIGLFIKSIWNIREVVNNFEYEWTRYQDKLYSILESKWVTISINEGYNTNFIQFQITNAKIWLKDTEIIDFNTSDTVTVEGIIIS